MSKNFSDSIERSQLPTPKSSLPMPKVLPPKPEPDRGQN